MSATGRPVPSATVHAERGIALIGPAMRAVVVLQILLSVSAGARLVSKPGAYVAITCAVLALSVLLIAQCLSRRSVRTGVWHYPDLALAWISVPAMSWLVPPTHIVGTWEAWASGYVINVAALAALWMRPRAAVINSLALGLWCFAWTSAVHSVSWQTTLGNALTIPGYAVVVALIADYIRRLAAAADQAREDAVAATRALELERYQLTVHDASSILRLLSDEDTPEEVLPGLRVQGDREARRLRHYLGGPVHVAGDESARTVGTMLTAALEGFDDLPLEVAIDLGASAEMSDAAWDATGRAVMTVLQNARLHAGAHQVVVHADTDGDIWEVVVSDDGIGFDQADQPLGFGLSTQVTQALESLGLTATIESAPGSGTAVTIIGPVASRATA